MFTQTVLECFINKTTVLEIATQVLRIMSNV